MNKFTKSRQSTIYHSLHRATASVTHSHQCPSGSSESPTFDNYDQPGLTLSQKW